MILKMARIPSEMRLGPGYVVACSEVEPGQSAGDSAETRLAVEAGAGSERLEVRQVRFGVGRSQPQVLGGLHGVLYVVEGRGTLEVAGEAYDLEPDVGVYVPVEFVVENPGPEDILTVLVVVGERDGTSDPERVRLADSDSLPAGTDREFRYVVQREPGSGNVTQFVGVIPPGRAPDHSHVYDEIVYVFEGESRRHF